MEAELAFYFMVASAYFKVGGNFLQFLVQYLKNNVFIDFGRCYFYFFSICSEYVILPCFTTECTQQNAVDFYNIS